MHEPTQHDLVARSGATGRGQRWLARGAWAAFALAAWQVGIWINHWYVAERFLSARGGGPDGGDWWAAADLMSSGNRALVAGVCWLGVMAVFIAVATIARRRSKPDRTQSI